MKVPRRNFIKSASATLMSLQAGASLGAAGRTIEIESGKVRGADLGGVHAFKGIPYGAPTDGKRRFMPPEKPEGWTGIRDATQLGASAPQLRMTGQVAPPWVAFCMDPPGLEYNENCLVLNVWTPAPDTGKRPVMFWIHGGGYSVGSASPPSYDGANLARSQDVVVVSLNHRLNALGFLDLSAVSDSRFADAGNVGMLDIVAALQWVKTNIHAFGGDADCVTIFGESGGGAKVAHLLAMPVAQGLFHRAIIESGPALRSGTHETHIKSTDMLLAELNLTSATAGKLQEVPLESFMTALASVSKKGGALGFGPVVDGRSVPHHPFDPVAPNESADIPVMVGYNHTETTFLRFGDTEAFTLDEARLHERLKKMAGDNGEQIFAAYKAAYPHASPADLHFYMTTDVSMGNGSHTLAERKAALGKAPAYVYRFDWQTPVDGGKMRAAHTVEIPFAFNNMTMPIVQRSLGDDPRNGALAAKVSGVWATFARTGAPEFSGLPNWRPYDTQHRATMLFDYESKCVDDPQGEARRSMRLAKVPGLFG